MRPTVQATIVEDSWVPVKYRQAIWDDQLRAWISEAEVAETRIYRVHPVEDEAITARLVIRRVRRRDPGAPPGQGKLFAVYRYERPANKKTTLAEARRCR
jgi:hypothetical protein